MPCSNSRWYQLAVARGYKFLPYRCSSDAAHSIQDLQPQWSQDPRVLNSSARITNVRHIEYLLALMGVAFNKVVSINSVGPPTDYDQVGSRSRPAGLEDNGPSISPNACIKEPPEMQPPHHQPVTMGISKPPAQQAMRNVQNAHLGESHHHECCTGSLGGISGPARGRIRIVRWVVLQETPSLIPSCNFADKSASPGYSSSTQLMDKKCVGPSP